MQVREDAKANKSGLAGPGHGIVFLPQPGSARAFGAPVSSEVIPNAKLIAMLRRFMMEHAKSATRSVCLCPICVDARKLLEKAYPQAPGR